MHNLIAQILAKLGYCVGLPILYLGNLLLGLHRLDFRLFYLWFLYLNLLLVRWRGLIYHQSLDLDVIL